MGSGDIVRVHINDVNGKVKSGAPLWIGFSADSGRYAFGKMTGQNGQVIDYALTIPKGRTSRLFVGTALQVSDAQGAPVIAGKPGAVLTGPTEITITVR
jgi:hypothetical protein